MMLWRRINQSKPCSFLSSVRFRHHNGTLFSGHAQLRRSTCGAFIEDGVAFHSPEFYRWKNGGGFIHSSAKVDTSALVEIGAIVHKNCVLDTDVHIFSGAVVGPSVSIGKSTAIGYNAVLSHCSIGVSCQIHGGVCIGQDGFGFLVDAEGQVQKKPQCWYDFLNVFDALIGDDPNGDSLLHVRIGDHVEIGANACIDRGSWRDTVVGNHTKIDNLVQIGHNVVIGKCCMLCGQVGVAGSVTIGDYVTLGGRVAVRDHVSIASKVRLAANSSVTKDITESGDYGGFPAVPIHEWRRQAASMRSLLKKATSKT